MSFERPGPKKDRAISDTEVNEALENGHVDESGLNVDELEHADDRRSSGPERTEDRRPPRGQDVTGGTDGEPIEPPD